MIINFPKALRNEGRQRVNVRLPDSCMGKVDDLKVFFEKETTPETLERADINLTNIIVASINELHKSLVMKDRKVVIKQLQEE